MINPKIEKFLEKNNLTYLYLLLANLEVDRLNALPQILKEKFNNKITEIAMEHVALNVVPDYIFSAMGETAEAEETAETEKAVEA